MKKNGCVCCKDDASHFLFGDLFSEGSADVDDDDDDAAADDDDCDDGDVDVVVLMVIEDGDAVGRLHVSAVCVCVPPRPQGVRQPQRCVWVTTPSH